MDIRRCEVCGQTFMSQYGYSLMLCWVTTGHHAVMQFNCPATGPSGQHWGCCAEHAIIAAQKCLTEHMDQSELLARHDATGKPRYSEEDRAWAETKGENFHFVEVTGGPL